MRPQGLATVYHVGSWISEARDLLTARRVYNTRIGPSRVKIRLRSPITGSVGALSPEYEIKDLGASLYATRLEATNKSRTVTCGCYTYAEGAQESKGSGMGPDVTNRFEASAALQHLRCAKQGEVLQSLETVGMRRIMQRKPVFRRG